MNVILTPLTPVLNGSHLSCVGHICHHLFFFFFMHLIFFLELPCMPPLPRASCYAADRLLPVAPPLAYSSPRWRPPLPSAGGLLLLAPAPPRRSSSTALPRPSAGALLLPTLAPLRRLASAQRPPRPPTLPYPFGPGAGRQPPRCPAPPPALSLAPPASVASCSTASPRHQHLHLRLPRTDARRTGSKWVECVCSFWADIFDLHLGGIFPPWFDPTQMMFQPNADQCGSNPFQSSSDPNQIHHKPNTP